MVEEALSSLEAVRIALQDRAETAVAVVILTAWHQAQVLGTFLARDADEKEAGSLRVLGHGDAVWMYAREGLPLRNV
jgi:hypothetical protein